ncbi:MAG TPA: hypothetical protein VMH87_17370 [Pseudomonadales bacterium]|nr:hypothetical protein [Pseudomonadales bacterium]
MIKAIFFIILIAGLLASGSKAQANEFQIQTNNDWGSPVSGVQMSITVSNTIISTGSGFIINIVIRNSSTNIIKLGESSPEKDFTAILTDKSGRLYQLTRNDPFFTRLLRMDLKSGESHNWILGVETDKYYESSGFIATNSDIPQGNYTLSVTRNFSVSNGRFKLESNVLKIQIR